MKKAIMLTLAFTLIMALCAPMSAFAATEPGVYEDDFEDNMFSGWTNNLNQTPVETGGQLSTPAGVYTTQGHAVWDGHTTTGSYELSTVLRLGGFITVTAAKGAETVTLIDRYQDTSHTGGRTGIFINNATAKYDYLRIVEKPFMVFRAGVTETVSGAEQPVTSLAGKQGKTLNVRVQAKNNQGGQDRTYDLVAAVYSGDKLIACAMGQGLTAPFTSTAADAGARILQISIPPDADDSADLKLFYWDSITDMTPMIGRQGLIPVPN